jgi:hypothetical protein
MGMYDSIKDTNDHEWQTKALGRGMKVFRIGDEVPVQLEDCQVKIFGGDGRREDWTDSLMTIRDFKIVSVDDKRDQDLPLIDYTGGRDRGGK